MKRDLDYYDQKNYRTIVFTCIECNSEGCGRDLNYRIDDNIPEVSTMECPVCGEFTLHLDREKTKELSGIEV